MKPRKPRLPFRVVWGREDKNADFYIPPAYTFADVTLVPLRSRVDSRGDPDLTTKISRTITLKTPIISSYMDTVTEEDMAIEMARLGGIGILHRFCSIDREVEMIKAVKRKEELVIEDPYSIGPDATIRDVRKLMRKTAHSIVVVDENGKFLGIVQYWHQLFETDETLRVRDLMIPAERALSSPAKDFAGLDQQQIFEKADIIFKQDKIQKRLVLLDEGNCAKGLVTLRNVKNRKNPRTTRDSQGRLAVAASVGIAGNYIDRAIACHEAGADALVVCVAHGHLEKCLNAVREIKKQIPDSDVIAGTIATEEGADDLFRAGADSALDGLGNGSICKTRDVTGVGVPQLTALLWAAKAARRWKRPILNDGGISSSDDIVKALAAGASAVILGNLLAGTDNSPSEVKFIGGKFVKKHRGMASVDAKKKLLESEGYLDEEMEAELLASYASEGVEEGYVTYRGNTQAVVKALENGVRSGMSYRNALTVGELQNLREKGKLKFVQNSEAARREGHPHHLEFQQW